MSSVDNSAGKQRPADVLAARYQQYHDIAKSLCEYFDSLADAHRQTATSLRKSADNVPLPFPSSEQFISESGGWQHALYSLREHSRTIAELHSNLADSVTNSVVSPLQRARTESKQFVARINEDLGKLSDEVDTERAASAKAITEHSHGISLLHAPTYPHAAPRSDPFITRAVVEKQLLKQLHLENRLTNSIISHQQSARSFEHTVNENLRDACRAFTKANAQMHHRLLQENEKSSEILDNIDPDAEWNYFISTRHAQLVDPDTPLRDPEYLTFPFKDHPSTTPIKQGYLERKSRIRKAYREDLFVVTQAGFLHQYEATSLSGNDPAKLAPVLSLYLPECTLGPAAKETEKKQKFYIQGKRNVASGSDSHFKSLNFRKKELQWTFKAKTHGDMTEWWKAVDRVARDSLTLTTTPSEAVQQFNAVNDAVKNVGVKQEEAQKEEGEQEQKQDEKQAKVSFVNGASTSGQRDMEEAQEEEQAKVEKGDNASVITGSSDEADLVDAATAPGFSSTTLDKPQNDQQKVSADNKEEEEELPGYVNTGHEVPPEKEKSQILNNIHNGSTNNKKDTDDDKPNNNRASTSFTDYLKIPSLTTTHLEGHDVAA